MSLELPESIPPSHHWNVATLPVTVAQLESRGYGLRRDIDDLDSFIYTEFVDEVIGHVLLVLRDHAPLPELGFDMEVQATVETSEALAAVERIFGFSPVNLPWVTPFPHFPGEAGELLDPPLTDADRERIERESAAWFEEQVQKKQQRELRQPA